jgi:lipopolysaccharide biosynthesis glycosyltransferase
MNSVDLRTPPLTVPKWSITRFDPPEKLVVACVCYGKKYPDKYVHKLKKSVEFYLGLEEDFKIKEFSFVCLSDREIEGVETIPLPRGSEAENFEGWWHKINLFHPKIFPEGARVLYLDLDVVVTGDLTGLTLQWTGEPLTMVYNFGPNRSHCAHNSSVMLWTAGDERILPVWLEFQNRSGEIMRSLHGDQCWIWRALRENIANFPRDFIASYKYDVRGKPGPDGQVRVVVFHGNPKPESCREPWIVKNWHER